MSVNLRSVARRITAHRQREGAGFIVARPFPGRISDEEADPFLLLDEFGPIEVNHKSPGAPWHPHRGFDTVTYMKKGSGAHQDSMGSKGVIGEGECQWMRAGSGVIHDEGRPFDMKPGVVDFQHGFQLWVNLPKKMKMSSPSYQLLTRERFVWESYTQFGSIGTRVKLIAGQLSGAAGVQALTSPLETLGPAVLFGDFEMEKGGSAIILIPDDMQTAMVYVYSGKARVYGAESTRPDDVPLSEPLDTVLFDCNSRGAIRVASPVGPVGFMLLAGQRIDEPIARRGPFVMNTEEEIMQAFMDYEAGKLATVKAPEVTH